MGRRIAAATDARNVPLIDPSKMMGKGAASPPRRVEPPQKVIVQHDTVSEGYVIAACALDAATRKKYIHQLYADHFQAREHADAWAAIVELERQHLDYDEATIESIAGEVPARTIARLVLSAPDAAKNVAHHVRNLVWDRTKTTAINGPMQKLIESFKDPTAEPHAVRAHARALLQSLDGDDRQWIHDPKTLVREQMKDVENRVAGRAVYPYGIDGLDYYNDQERDGEPMRRMIPGAAPGQITVVTGVSGGGKSTFTAHIALGLARIGRRVLWGAWEMKGGMNLELMACISLGWSRQDLTEGRGIIASYEGRVALEDRMDVISQHVGFLKNPFRRGHGSPKSGKFESQVDRNLDLLHGILSDSGCDVFIADLWKRCLPGDVDPGVEEEALVRQQMMAEELGQHHVLLQQQRLKDVENRPDKRPSREGIKGSGAWIEVPDTIIGMHRPALFKKIDDDRIEAIILKQRYGKWPLAVEFLWNPEYGSIEGGRSIEYERPGEASEVDTFSAASQFLGQRPGKRKKAS